MESSSVPWLVRLGHLGYPCLSQRVHMVQGGGLCVVPGYRSVDDSVDSLWTKALLRRDIRRRLELDV